MRVKWFFTKIIYIYAKVFKRIIMNKKKSKYKWSFLFPRNNFLVGLGSVLNVAGSYFIYNKSKPSDGDADLNALKSDWEIIGEDFKNSKKEFEKANKDELCLKF